MSISKERFTKSILTEEELDFLTKINNKINSSWKTACPNSEYFEFHTGKEYGTVIEKLIIGSFLDLSGSNDTSYDAISNDGDKIEIKSTRAGTKGYNEVFLVNDDIYHAKLANCSFQQMKPYCCDWFLLHILFGDGNRAFLVPSKMVSSKVGKKNYEHGKFYLGTQHRGNENEGVLNVKHLLRYSKIFEIKDYDLSGSYNYNVLKRQVMENLDRINWVLK